MSDGHQHQRAIESRILAIARLVRRGEWTTYGDISAAVTGNKRAARAVARAAAESPRFPNAHRVLRSGGFVERGAHPAARAERERAREKLRLEGVDFDVLGRADPSRCVHWDELQRRAGRVARASVDTRDMLESELLRRARSFGPVADDYQAGRPVYPLEAVHWLAGSPPRRTVDLGAGTGKLTQQLVALGHDTAAVEPLVPMLQRLRASLPDVPPIAGAAEAIPLRDACADVVTAGQALHWFDLSVALPEIARVLAPGGVLGIVWNARDESVDWVREFTRSVEREGPVRSEWKRGIEASGLFGPIQERTFRFEQTLDRDGLIALVRSRSYFAVASAERRARVLASIEELWETHPQLAGRDTATLPYTTHAYRIPVRASGGGS